MQFTRKSKKIKTIANSIFFRKGKTFEMAFEAKFAKKCHPKLKKCNSRENQKIKKQQQIQAFFRKGKTFEMAFEAKFAKKMPPKIEKMQFTRKSKN